MFARTLSVAAIASIFSLVACAGSEPNESVASDDQAATSAEPSCGAGYATANAAYKEAVKLAKQHKTDACGGFTSEGDEGAYLTSIARFAARANASCGAFENIIKTSPWAAPIREELAGNLALHVLTGDLEIKDASGAYTYKGLETALASGVTLWGPAPGAYGNASKMEFKGNGKVTLSHQQWDENADMPRWVSEEATYRVGNAEGDTVMITIETAPGIGTDYDLKATDWDGAPDFSLTPIEKETDVFTAYISECEA